MDFSSPLVKQLALVFKRESFIKSLNNDCRAYRDLAMELIFLCRFSVQAHDQNLNSSILLRKVLIAADRALKSAVEAGDWTSEKADKEFREAIELLRALEKSLPFKDPTSGPNISQTIAREAQFETILYALEKNLHSKPMGNQLREPTRVIEFHLLSSSSSDAHPIVVKQVLSDSPSIQEILWNFCRFKDERQRLTLKENPHFYEDISISRTARGSVKLEPTNDFRRANEFYVLTDRQEPVHIMTDRVSQSFANFWCSQNVIIFKDICGTLRGENMVKASLGGTYCGFCKRLPVSTFSGASSLRRGLQPIITEGCSWTGWKCLNGCLPVHGSVDIGLRVCTGRAVPDTPLLVPFPPTSEQPEYRVLYRTHLHILDDDSLLQIFSYYRQSHEKKWNLRHMWRTLAQVCRRWRYLIYDSSYHLDICLLLTNDSPSIGTLSHLPPLPLVIDYSDRTQTIAREDENNICLALRQHGRVRRIVLRAPSSSLQTWLAQMNQLFPKLGDLSLSSTATEMSLVLPETLRAPDLRRLSLHGISPPIGLSLLPSTIALSTLSLTHIGANSYFSPRCLITHLRGLPHLEELSIGFAIPIPLPSSEGELLPAPMSPVKLPNLRQFTFRGVDVYLNNFVAQINTPLLKQLKLTLFFDLTFTLVNLVEFIHRIEGFRCLIARIMFKKDGASVDVGHYEQRGVAIQLADIGKLSLHINCSPIDWQIDSATQVCSALGNVMSTVKELTLDLDEHGMPLDWENTLDSTMWHALLLPFTGVEKLRIGFSLTHELSQALEPVAGGLVAELLPELQELEVHAGSPFSAFVETLKSMGRPVRRLKVPTRRRRKSCARALIP